VNLIIIPNENYVRSQRLGGSDIAGVLGLQPQGWRTSVGIWGRKQEREEEPEAPKEVRKRFARGHVVEPLVATLLEVMHNITGTTKGHRYADPLVPYFAAEIDMEIPFGAVRHLFLPLEQYLDVLDTEIVNIEIKTVHPFAAKEWGEEGSEDIPIHYAAQVYWGLGVTGRRFALCAALFGADDLVLYPVVADPNTITVMREKADRFWKEHVVTGIPPAPTNVKDAAFLWPTDDGSTVETSPQVSSACVTLDALSASRKSYEKGEEGVSLLIREYMKNASILVEDGIEIATLKAQNTQSIDTDKLKTEFPDVYKACRRVKTTRVLRLKEIKT
jgi:predicted phage-related endonuclease